MLLPLSLPLSMPPVKPPGNDDKINSPWPNKGSRMMALHEETPLAPQKNRDAVVAIVNAQHRPSNPQEMTTTLAPPG